MKLCGNGHDEIAFEGSKWDDCPICKALAEKDERIAELETEVKDLTGELASATEQLGEQG